MGSSSSDKAAPLLLATATATAAAGVVALAIGVGAGWCMRSQSPGCRASDGGGKSDCADGADGAETAAAAAAAPNEDTRTRRMCECGFDLTSKADFQIQRHLSGRQHRVNLYRTMNGPPVLVTAKINEYRDAITTHVVPTDVTLEIGCAEGLTTQRLAQRSRVAVGIDQHDFLINRARARVGQPPEQGCGEDTNTEAGGTDNDGGSNNDEAAVFQAPAGIGWSNLHFHVADAFDKKALIDVVDRALGITPEAESAAFRLEAAKVKAERTEAAAAAAAAVHEAAVADNGVESMTTSPQPLTRKQKRELRKGREEGLHSGKVTKIFLDVSGSRETRVVVHLIDILSALFRPELIVVKSDKLKNLVRRSYLPSSTVPGITHEPVHTPYVIN